MVVNVVILSHIGAVIPLIILTHASPGQNLDGFEEIREVPRTDGLGHDVVFQVPWNLGSPEEDHAFCPIRQRVAAGVVLQIGCPGHIRKLE